MANSFRLQNVRKADVGSLNQLVGQINKEFDRVSRAIDDILAGRSAFTGDLDLGGNRAKNAGTPRSVDDLVTLGYAEDNLGGEGTATDLTSEGSTGGSTTSGTSEEDGGDDLFLSLLDDVAATGVVFGEDDGGGGATFQTDVTNFNWDDTNNFLGLSIATPLAPLDLRPAAATDGVIAILGNEQNDPIQVSDGAVLRFVMDQNAVAAGTNLAGDIRIVVDAISNLSTQMAFYIADASVGSIRERLRLDEGGVAVSFGGQNPRELLDIEGGKVRVEDFLISKQVDNDDIMQVRSAITTATSAISVVPNGAPVGTKAAFQLYATDREADQVNYERLSIATDGSVYRFLTVVGGTGSHLPIDLEVAENDRLLLGLAETVVNEDGGDFDFRVETTGQASQFVVDAGTDQVGFNNVLYSWPAADAAGVLISDGAGNLSWSLAATGIDHGGLGGLTDVADHPDYILRDGTRTFSDFIDIDESSIPDPPAANVMRLYAEDFHGFPFLSFKDDGGIVRKLVRDSVFLAYNNRGTTIAAGRIVYATGAFGDVPTIDTAKADSSATMPAIGVTIESIADTAYGRVMQVGLLENVNTSGYSTGDVLYVSAATAGVPTATAPLYPNLRQEIGTILVSDASVGAIQLVARTVQNDSVIDHGGLLGIADDDHSGHPWLLGRSGGQTLIGGVDPSDDLTLYSTSDATKGNVIFGLAGTSVYDEVNSRWGFGTNSPSYTLHISGSQVGGPIDNFGDIGLGAPLVVIQNSLEAGADALLALIGTGAAGSTCGILMGDEDAGGEGYLKYSPASGLTRLHGKTYLHLSTAGQPEAIFCDATGVGIQNASPSEVLDVTGNVKSSGQFISTLAIGTAPLAVTSTTLCTNLNADLLDGVEASELLLLAGRAGAANDFTMSTSTDANITGSTAASADLYFHANTADDDGLFRFQDEMYLREDFPGFSGADVGLTHEAVYWGPAFSYSAGLAALNTAVCLCTNPTVTVDTNLQAPVYSAVLGGGTFTFNTSGALFKFKLFNAEPVVTSNTASAPPGGTKIFNDESQVIATGANNVGTVSAVETFYSWPRVRTQDTAQMTVTVVNGLVSEATLDESGGALNITTRRGVYVRNATVPSGVPTTFATQVGMHIDDLTNATNNLSLSSAGAAVEMRHAGPAVFGQNAAVGTNEIVRMNQTSTSGAIPVLLIDQADVDEPFIKFVGDAAAANLTRNIVDVGDVSTATVAGYVKVEVQDDGNQITDQDYFLPLYTLS